MNHSFKLLIFTSFCKIVLPQNDYPDNCLSPNICEPGECCALGTTCNTCPYGFVASSFWCSGRGDRQCRYAPPSFAPTTPITTPSTTLTTSGQNIGTNDEYACEEKSFSFVMPASFCSENQQLGELCWSNPESYCYDVGYDFALACGACTKNVDTTGFTWEFRYNGQCADGTHLSAEQCSIASLGYGFFTQSDVFYPTGCYQEIIPPYSVGGNYFYNYNFQSDTICNGFACLCLTNSVSTLSPSDAYTHHPNTNCYNGNGADNLSEQLDGKTLEEVKQICIEMASCDGFGFQTQHQNYEVDIGRYWLRSNIQISDCVENADLDMYVKSIDIPSSSCSYESLGGLALDEGNILASSFGDFEAAKEACDDRDMCQSFGYCAGPQVVYILFDNGFSGGEPLSDRTDCTTYYKVCSRVTTEHEKKSNTDQTLVLIIAGASVVACIFFIFTIFCRRRSSRTNEYIVSEDPPISVQEAALPTMVAEDNLSQPVLNSAMTVISMYDIPPESNNKGDSTRLSSAESSEILFDIPMLYSYDKKDPSRNIEHLKSSETVYNTTMADGEFDKQDNYYSIQDRNAAYMQFLINKSFIREQTCECKNVLDSDDVVLKLDVNNLIGKGNFGKIYIGEYRDCKCAFKLVDITTLSDFIFESDLFMTVSQHPCVCRYYGMYVKSASLRFIVMDYFPCGSVLDAMKSHKFTDRDKMDMCSDISKSLSHLRREGVIHADLALRNFLIESKSNSIRIALTDFGMSTFHPCKKPVAQLAPRWASSDFINTRIPTFASDLWACGVVFWEVYMDGMLPYPHISRKDLMKKLSKDELRPKVNLAWPMAGVMDQIFDREIDIKEVVMIIKNRSQLCGTESACQDMLTDLWKYDG